MTTKDQVIEQLMGAIMGAAYDFRDAHISGSANLKRSAHAALETATKEALSAAKAVEPKAHYEEQPDGTIIPVNPSEMEPQPERKPLTVEEIEAKYARMRQAQQAQQPVGFISPHDIGMLRQGHPRTIVMLAGAKHTEPLYTGPQRELVQQARDALDVARDNLRPHGDNCHLHNDGGEYDACFCGRDSLISHFEQVTIDLDLWLEANP